MAAQDWSQSRIQVPNPAPSALRARLDETLAPPQLQV
jgi:hypothetical protein